MLSRKKARSSATRRGRRPRINPAFKVRVFSSDGDYWVEERCWRCGRVLNRHRMFLSTPAKEEINCPSCKAVNRVEREEV